MEKCKGEENISGKMDLFIRVNIKMEKNKV